MLRGSMFLDTLCVWVLFVGVSLALEVSSTILVFARDTASSLSATSGLKGYGIPYQVVIVPQNGITLPTLNSSSTTGNYGGFIIVSEVAYEYPTGWSSAITTAQWDALYSYQAAFSVRMVRLDVYPGSDTGTTTAIPSTGCCDDGIEQLVSFTDTSGFPTAGLKTGAGVGTGGLWHYPATITDSSTTKRIAKFGPGGPFTSDTTAAVINTFGTRQQLVWFISWGSEWSLTSNFIMHAHINWMTRGLFIGRRRIYFGTQVDDMQLATFLYQPDGARFRCRPSDLNAHVNWQRDLNARLPAGSSYFIEIGHNGNGNIEWALPKDDNDVCVPPSMIEYEFPPDTPLEFQKPLGTGTDLWPTTPATYSWSKQCIQLDDLASWFMVARNRDQFAHVSHTFSHIGLNNATYSDTSKEISFNQAWLIQTSISASSRFSPKGLIPPAITGLHNGDAIKAFMDNGLAYVVGDNSRRPLSNTQNEYWPLISNVANNGYAGLVIIPRWSSPIYFNCDLADCTLAEWIKTSGGWGDFNSLLEFSRRTYTRHLLALRHDPFMFHQANMRQGDTPSFTVGSKTGNLSLLQIFTEVLLQELTRLTTWPVVTLKQDDLAVQYTNRMTRDACQPNLSYTITNGRITAATVKANGNTCSVPIPATFPVTATASGATTTNEKLGSDPLIVWTTLRGNAVKFTLSAPITL